jgi:uncharacterized protein YndB with AHSA1/START domain
LVGDDLAKETMTMGAETIRHAVQVPGTSQQVFDLFCTLGVWWPLAYTFSEARFEDAAVERKEGGRWFERDVEGKETGWGDVRAFEEGRRLVLGWAIGPDRRPAPPDQASEVEVRFEAAAGGTRVSLEHRAFDRHGQAGEALRGGMSSPQGWPLILAEFRRAARLRDRSPAAATGGQTRS